MRQLRKFAIVTVALTSLLAGCGNSGSGGASAAADSKAFNYTGSDRQSYLESCAKSEGSLTWYTSLAGDVIDDMIAAFKKKYPGISVDTFRGDEAEIASRVAQETSANRLQGDIVEVTSDAYRAMADTGVIGTFTTPDSSKYSARFTLKDSSGKILGLGDRASYVGFAYNTDKVPASAVPKTLQDLLNPALKGKLAITDSTTGVRFVGNVLTTLGDEKGRAFLKQLATQNVRVESVSGAALAGLISTGEVDASPGIFRNHVQQIAGNAPIKWVPIEPVTANVGYAGVFAKAQHPCAAMLFTDFLLGDDGTKIYHSLQYPRPDENLGFKSWVPDETFKTVKDYDAASQTWQDLFDQTFR